MKREVVYFEQPGPGNTGAALVLARERAEALGITRVVIATTTGDTALQAAQAMPGRQLIVVVRPPREGRVERLDPQVASQLREIGCSLLTPAEEHPEVRALRAFGSGAKVACEVAVRAAEAGLIGPEDDAIAIAGSSRGADTVLVLRPAVEPRLVRVRELVCKPY